MSQVLATYNIKGGVGKTSAAVNLAYLASRDGARTLLWDLDPQGAATFLFRVRPKVRGGSRKLLALKSRADRLIKETDHEGLDLLPADFSYRHMDLALDHYKRPTRRLSRVLAPLAGDYDVIVLDCPPSISLVSESVFEAADALLVPVIPAALPARTFEQLAGLISERPRLLAFLSMLDISRPLHRELMSRLRREHPEAMLGAAIPFSEDVRANGIRAHGDRRVRAGIACGAGLPRAVVGHPGPDGATLRPPLNRAASARPLEADQRFRSVRTTCWGSSSAIVTSSNSKREDQCSRM